MYSNSFDPLHQNTNFKDQNHFHSAGNYEYYPQPMSLKDGSTINRSSDKVYLGMGLSKKGGECVLQDQFTDGALGTSTFFTAADVHIAGPRGLGCVSDPANVPGHSSLGWHYIGTNTYDGNTHSSAGIRCIKDPNNAYMPSEFETEYVVPSDTIVR